MTHWRGEQPLWQAFWVNFIAFRVLIHYLQRWSLPAVDTDYSAIAPLVIALAAIFHGLVLIWQIVGVLRSAEAFLRETGSQAIVWGAQITLIVVLFLTFSHALEAWQTTLPVSTEENFLVRMDREHAEKYSLVLENDSRHLNIAGTIELGITRNLKALLSLNPGVRSVTLQSDGGNIYEARGLARIFRDGAMSTHVATTCSSACTAAFIGGNRRTLARDARLGFHQYRIEGNVSIINVDPQAEQTRDKALFREQGVSELFLEKMYSSASSEMWYPPHSLLLSEGVIHAVSDP